MKISESCCGSLAPLDLAEIILRVRLKEFVSIFEETHRFWAWRAGWPVTRPGPLRISTVG